MKKEPHIVFHEIVVSMTIKFDNFLLAAKQVSKRYK